jgi:hypothetical protein
MKHAFMLLVLCIGFAGFSPAQAACTCKCVDGSAQTTCTGANDSPPACPATTCRPSRPSAAPANQPAAPSASKGRCRQERICDFYNNCHMEQICQ